jgi:hypothetical protein
LKTRTDAPRWGVANMWWWGGADHGEEGDIAADLDAAHADLDHGALAVGVEERHRLVRRRRHEGPLDPPTPGRLAMRHPELGGQQHGPKTAIHLAAEGRAGGGGICISNTLEPLRRLSRLGQTGRYTSDSVPVQCPWFFPCHACDLWANRSTRCINRCD